MSNLNNVPSMHFKLDSDGYTEAVKWLKENDLYELIEKEQSTDGYNVVSLANKLYNDRNNQKTYSP